MSDSDDELGALLRQHATRHRAHPALLAGIRAELAPPTAASVPTARWPQWALGSLGLVVGLVLGISVMLLRTPAHAPSSVEAELVGNHVRALMADHLTDIASTEQHTVKPWFQGRLSFAPPVKDLTQEGFPLVGGRLDVVSGQPAAALVYRRRGHLINVFIWPTPQDTSPNASDVHGYHVLRWSADGNSYAVVSDLNTAELQTFAGLLK